MFVTDVSIGVVELARAVEERGLDSLWLPEHTHIPTSRTTPTRRRASCPRSTSAPLDPLVALAAAASATTTLRLGTGILLPAQRDPIVTAKAVATLDHVSGAGGWRSASGSAGTRTRSPTTASTSGERRAVGPGARARHAGAVGRRRGVVRRASTSASRRRGRGPSPSSGTERRPAVPVLVGAARARSCSPTREYGDGWIPIGGAGLSSTPIPLRAAAEAAATGGVRGRAVRRDPDHGKLDHYDDLGVTETVFDLPSAPRDEILPVLDRFAALAAERRPPPDVPGRRASARWAT